jgi:hypothetical protein
LRGGIDAFVERREKGDVDAFLEEAGDDDFEWFEDEYFGEFDRTTNRWSGFVEEMHVRTVAYVLKNIGEFVVGAR